VKLLEGRGGGKGNLFHGKTGDLSRRGEAIEVLGRSLERREQGIVLLPEELGILARDHPGLAADPEHRLAESLDDGAGLSQLHRRITVRSHVVHQRDSRPSATRKGRSGGAGYAMTVGNLVCKPRQARGTVVFPLGTSP
jgi:hypothetical protein